MNLILVPPETSICIIGDIHEHPEQFFGLIDQYNPGPQRWIVSVGDVYDKGFGLKAAERITDELICFDKKGFGFATRGNHEYKIVRKNANYLTEQLVWWGKRPLSLSFQFPSGKIITVVHGGISPQMTHPSCTEVIFARDVDELGIIPLKWVVIDGERQLVKSREGGTSWHNLYDGRFGYVVAGHHPQMDGVPKFYNYSCNIDTGVFETGILCGQIINSSGELGDLIKSSGEPYKLVQ
jgi:hypothetical protein